MKIKAVPTSYNGMRFDSRTEAFWAVLFDQLKIPYIHEPEGFIFSDGTKYLPDFYLPDQNAFFECKGVMSDKDLHKIEMLIKESGRPVIVGYTDFTFEACDDYYYGGDIPGGELPYERADKASSVLVKCPACGKYYFSATNGYYGCQCCNAYDGDHYFLILWYGDEKQNVSTVTHDGRVLHKAISYALSKKFDKRDNR